MSDTIAGYKFWPKCFSTVDEAQKAGLECIVESITHFTSLLLFVIAVSAFLYFLYGAFLYVSSFGEEAKAAQAKKTMTAALIGVFLATLAGIILRLLASILGVDVPATP